MKGARVWDFRWLGFSWFLHHSGLVILGLKYKLVPLTFGGARHHLISVAHAESAHKFLTHTLSARIMFWRPFSNFLKVRISSWPVCSRYTSDLDGYAQRTHQFLTCMLRVRISSWCVCSACFEGTALLKIIRLSLCIRNVVAPYEPLNFFTIFLFQPQNRPPVET